MKRLLAAMLALATIALLTIFFDPSQPGCPG
jgi:hypothetical protein